MFKINEDWQDLMKVWIVSCEDGGSFSVGWSRVPVLSVTFDDEQAALDFVSEQHELNFVATHGSESFEIFE